MDKTVPRGAASLLAFIARTETSRGFPDAYEVIYGHNQAKLPKRLTAMTLAEVQAAQSGWSKSFGSSATGAYQFMKATLAGLISELRLGSTQVLDGNLQDRLGYHLLLRRGYADWVAGRINDVEFAKRLAQEWASFPVLEATKGSTRQLSAGQSYYAGDGLNKALVSPQTVRSELTKARALASGAVLPSQPDIDHFEPPVSPLPVDTPDEHQTPDAPSAVNGHTGLIVGLAVVAAIALAIAFFIPLF